MPPRADNKEHHLCFAYKGERMREELFEDLKFANAQGTTAPDGLQLVRISLQKQNGRRGHTIHKIIDQYNRNAASDIKPAIAYPQQQQAICCFKLTQPVGSNPILLRIAADKGSPPYWSWTCGAEKPAKKTKDLRPLIEKTLVEELRVDPSTLPIQRVCEEIQAKMEDAEDERTVNIAEELKRYIGREQMYLVAPPSASIFNMDADPVFKDDGKDEPLNDDSPNDTIKAYFRTMLPQWGEVAHVAAEDVTKILNARSAGLYKRSCVASFMRPFIKDGSVETKDNVNFTIHTRRVAQKIIN